MLRPQLAVVHRLEDRLDVPTYFAVKQGIDYFPTDDLVHLEELEHNEIDRPSIRHCSSRAPARVCERMKYVLVNIEDHVVRGQDSGTSATFYGSSPEESYSLTFKRARVSSLAIEKRLSPF